MGLEKVVIAATAEAAENQDNPNDGIASIISAGIAKSYSIAATTAAKQ